MVAAKLLVPEMYF